MNLLLMRHAQAAVIEGKPDRERPLTDLGREQALKMAHVLQERGFTIDRIAVSPLRRTQETAAIVASVFADALVEISEALIPTGDAPDVRPYLDPREQYRNVLIIAHHPDLSILSNSYGAPQIFLVPGAVAVFEHDDGQSPRFCEQLSPDTLFS